MRTISHYINKLAEGTLLGQASWYATGQVLAQACSFFSVIITSRYLGPTNLGLASFAQNYLAVFATITAGMDFYFTWKIAKSEERIKDLKEYLGHKFHIMIFFTVIGVISAWYILPTDVAQMATIILAPMFLMAAGTFAQYAVTVNGANVIALSQGFGAFLSFAVKVGLVYIKAPLIAFIAVSAFDMSIAGVFIALYYYLNKEVRTKLSEYLYPSVWKTITLMYKIRMSLIAIAVWQLVTRVDQLVLATFTSAYMLGIYSSAVKIALVPNFLAGALYSALTMRVALFAGKDDDFSKNRIRQALLIYLVIGLGISVFIIITAPFLVALLFGSQFLEAIPVLRAYSLSIPGMFILFHYLAVYGAQERHQHQILFFVAALIVNIVLIYTLTPLWGLVGAALATAFTYNLLAGAFFYHVK